MEGQTNRRRFFKYFFSLLAFGAGSICSFGENTVLKKRKSSPFNTFPSEAKANERPGYNGKIIGVEEHFTSELILNTVRSKVESGAKYNLLFDYKTDGISSTTGMTIGEKRLKDMDEAGIDMQVLSSTPYHEGFLDPSEGTSMSETINNEIHKIIKKDSKRFAGFAGLACQDPDAAANELERSVKKLGLKGAIIYSHIQGEYLDDQKFWPVFEKAEKLDVPIYIHPKDPSPGMIGAYSKYPILADAMWGFAADVGLHAMRLICSGLFDEYPGLKIILGHLGEGIPYWLWRLDSRSGRGTPQNGLLCKKKPSQYIKDNFYVTTSGMFWPPVLEFAHSVLGADRILFAVDYPAQLNSEAVKSIESMSISDEDKEKIFHLNAERLLKI
ncbi:amidohydrolase family protein [Deltaproteobacteria bacterium]|nr:amidohydrolase family protein [Deltaproteobacteria bacterium]